MLLAVGKETETDKKHTEKGVELHWDQVQAAVWIVTVVFSVPLCVIKVRLCAERVQNTKRAPERHVILLHLDITPCDS